jgi:hypothetical protein
LLAESRWNRIHGYEEIPILVKEMELAAVKAMPLKLRNGGIIRETGSRRFN